MIKKRYYSEDKYKDIPQPTDNSSNKKKIPNRQCKD